MIYLVDDTPAEMIGGYLRLEDYSDVMTRLSDVTPDDLRMMKSADCILVHSSFHDTSVRRIIPATVSDYGDAIPLVMFSDGDMPDAEFDGDRYITAFKKSRMYSLLPIFLCTFRNLGVVDLRVLSDGEHHLRKEANTVAMSILSPFMFLDGSEAVALDQDQRKALAELVSLSQPEIAVDGVSPDSMTEGMTIATFRKKVNDIVDSFNRYGKNIHSWR